MDNGVCNPVWPCAMIGACSVLSGFDGMSVIIHGSSGCYYYPKSLLKVPIYSTFLLESEIVMGSTERLAGVVSQAPKEKGIAVLNTCVPALTGEDLTCVLPENAILVDAPGFAGNLETGMKKAYEALNIPITSRAGVNIDGISLFDLFWRGNLHEAERVLSSLGIPIALRLAKDSWENLQKGAASRTVSVNPGFSSGIGENIGSLLFPEFCGTVALLCDAFQDASADSVLNEWKKADEQMFYYADKFLCKYNPPRVFAAGLDSYCTFAKYMMQKYFGADVEILPRSLETDLEKIAERISACEPELILGSTFEANLSKEAAFFGIAIPDRSRVSFSAYPISGIEGGIMFVESVLNAMIDH